jgi:hypothetical protein
LARDRANKELHMDGTAIGIDLGSAASSMAWATSEGQVQVICNAEGDPTTPSAIDFSQSPPIVGKPAWKRRLTGAPEVVTLFRRWMGTGQVHRFGDHDWTAVDMEALLLAKLRRDAEAALQRPITRAAIGTPAYLVGPQVDSCYRAALLAGFEKAHLIQEPVAAVLAYMNRHRLTDGVYIVYDLSAVTFDASLIKITDSDVTVVAIDGDNFLGTIDWTQRIAAWISEHEDCASPSAPRDDAKCLTQLMPIAELLNEAMYTRPEAHFSLDGRTQRTFTRTQFEELTADLLQQTAIRCERLLKKGNISWEKVDAVMLAGEAARIPTVVDFVRRISGKDPLPIVAEAIAVGAAIWAALLDGGADGALPESPKEPVLQLPPEGTRLRVVDTLVVNRGGPPARIELCVGDLTTLQAEDAVDVLIVSAFPDCYTPLPGSLIGALARKGISVEELARHKEVDLRQSFSCWMSPRLVNLPPGIHFVRILCFEPYARGAPAELVGDIFRSLSPFIGENPPIRTVATPIPASGYQCADPEKMLWLLVQAAVHWMAVGMPLSRLKVCALPGPNVESLQNAFQELKRACAPQAPTSANSFKYDVFMSYAHADLNEVSIFEHKLTEAMPEVRLFIDRKALNPGAVWQQEIYESLDDCRKVVALLTPAYLGSKVCLEEFNIALCRNREADRQILSPVYLYSANLPTYMKVVQFFDCRECEPAKIDQVCHVLSEELSTEA